MKKIIVFDLDGTLLDTLGDLHAAVNHALKSENLPLRSIDEVRSFVGNGMRLLMERALPADADAALFAHAFAAFKAYYSANCAHFTREYDGITALLQKLKAEGALLGVVTNKADAPAKKLMEHYFPGLFDSVVGEREGVRRKPAPDSVWETVRTLGGSIDDAVYIGDSEVDAQTAKNAGTALVGVTWGFRSRETLEKAGAQLFADSPAELFEILKTMG